MAVLTSALSATVLAIRNASSRVAAPCTSMVTRCVAPSPSAGICLASSMHTSRNASWKRARSAPASGWSHAAPLANSSNVSLVLMWPSTLMQLKLSSTAATSDAWASATVKAASVSTTASIVAIRGPIMPAPLHMPASRTVRPPSSSVRPAILCDLSVVVMPRAANRNDASSLPKPADAARIPAAILSIGRNTPMMPVDMTSD